MTVNLSGRRCQCAACGKFFSGETAFDLHRVGKIVDVAPDYGRRCLDDGEMAERGMRFDGTLWRSSADTRDWSLVRSALA